MTATGGQRFGRHEDARLLSGGGRYLADIVQADALSVRFARSDVGSARLRSVEPPEDLPPGTLVVTGRDPVLEGVEIRHAAFDGAPMPAWPLLAGDRVHYYYQPLAAVLAEDAYVAEDVANQVEVDYEPLPAYLDPHALPTPGQVLHEEFPANCLYRTELSSGDVAQARSAAAISVRGRYRTNRQSASPLETRGCLAVPDADGLVVWSSTQIPFVLRELLARTLGWDRERVTVRAPDLGGGFGVKAHGYPEELLVALLAVREQRPVRWVEDRLENLAASSHARDHAYDLTLHLDADGRFLGLESRVVYDGGAYPIWPQTPARELVQAMSVLPGPYVVEHYECRGVAIATNKCPSGAYRGVGRPSAVFAMERLVDDAAREIGLDPAELRRRNLVTEFPHDTGRGMVYDTGSYAEALERACAAVRYTDVRQEQQAARPSRNPVYRGVGLACFVEQTGHMTIWALPEAGLVKSVDAVRVAAGEDGTFTVSSGFVSMGQGQETTLAQIVAETLGVAADRVRLLCGDTSRDPYALGSISSRTTVICGNTAVAAATKLMGRLRGLAAGEFGVDPAGVTYEAGVVTGAPATTDPRRLDSATLARRYGVTTPDGRRELAETETFAGAAKGTYANACHAAVVDVDARTGRVTVDRYVVVEDCGRVINQVILDGQIQGGVAQGIGGALYEELVYDPSGQLRTGTLVDYHLPTAPEIPEVAIEHLCSPGPGPLEAKGAGEAGAIGPMAVIANAVADALAGRGGAGVCEVPLTPGKVWGLLHEPPAAAPLTQPWRPDMEGAGSRGDEAGGARS